MTDEELREMAEWTISAHDPANQADNPYDRCAICHYTRFPCDEYDLASGILGLLARLTPSV